jgi:hypothetical protein
MIVSLNLPPVEQVVGARATRTTHPQALAGFRRLFAQVLDQTVEVINPFIWLTKTEVIDRIAANECGDLIPRTRSCTRVRDMTILHPHCGECSQCLDRRFAVLAAGQEHHDVADAYKVDLFTGERPRGPDREMALAYVRSASRVVGYFPEAADEVASRVLELHRRHVSSVCRVFDQAVSLHASALRQGSLPATCLLVLKVSRGEETPPEPERRSEEVFLHPSSEIPISIDEDRRRVVFERWGELAGTGAGLIIALSKPFKDSFQEARAPEHYSYTRTGALCSQINCANEETLRRQVLRLRKAIEALASKAGDLPPAMDAVIESSPWHGYRLNPDSVRIVAVGHMSTTLNEKVTARADR